MSEFTPYLEALIAEMEAHAIPSKGENMAAYLKNKFTCYGVKAPIRNDIQKRWFQDIKGEDFDPWDIAYNLWELEQREYQYIAVDFLKKLPKKKYRKEDYKKIEELITHKSWWETVDALASNIAGRYFQVFPEQIDPVITRWRKSDNMWLNRTSLLFQLKYKDQLDFELLKGLILQYLHVDEFFIQKAIGWVLREYSKTNPDAVREFIQDLDLSNLARREASKYL